MLEARRPEPANGSAAPAGVVIHTPSQWAAREAQCRGHETNPTRTPDKPMAAPAILEKKKNQGEGGFLKGKDLKMNKNHPKSQDRKQHFAHNGKPSVEQTTDRLTDLSRPVDERSHRPWMSLQPSWYSFYRSGDRHGGTAVNTEAGR